MFTGFIAVSFISIAVITVTSLLTYEILRLVWQWLPRMRIMPRLRVLLIVIPIFAAHILSIWIYALVYFFLELYCNFGTLSGNIEPAAFTYESFIERLFYSSSTYASLGLGDIFPTRDLRMLTAAEVLNGLVMIGWTVSFTYLTMERFWSMPHRAEKKPTSRFQLKDHEL